MLAELDLVRGDRLRHDHPHGGQPVQADELDQLADVRLRMAQRERAAVRAQSLRQAGQIDHQRRVGEPQLGQIDAYVARRVQRCGQRAPAQAGRRPVLIPFDEQGHLL